jgi:para-aminobenzoate synthetase/4-amino-4-deoxychorismate lyase
MTTEPVSGEAACEVLETLRLEDGRLVRRDGHVARAHATARSLGFNWRSTELGAALDDAIARHPSGLWRTRLLVSADGQPRVECSPLVHDSGRVWQVAFAVGAVDSADPRLRRKTTCRAVYEEARAGRPGVDDVLLWNERGEITESTIANVVVDLDGPRVTPPLTSGLLPGIYRAALLERGDIEEGVLTKADIESAARVWLVNSLREWMDVRLVK